jgi:hypothetical protein
MGTGDTIANNGKYTMTNLSNATGIGSYELSDHHPNLTNAETAFSDFVCKGVGLFINSGANQRRLPITLYGNQANEADGSYGTDDNWNFNNINGIRPGVRFTIFIPVYEADGDLGEHFMEALFRDGTVLTKDSTLTSSKVQINSVNITINGSGDDHNGVGLEIVAEVSEQIPRLFIAYTYDDPLNTNADNQGKTSQLNTPYDAGLVFATDEVLPAQVLITSWGMEILFNQSAGDYEIDHNPSAHFGEANYHDPSDDATNPTWELYDKDPNNYSPFATGSSSEFLEGNHGGRLEKKVAQYPSNSTMTWWMAIVDDAGNRRDVIKCILDDGDGTVDPWPDNDGGTEHYSFTSNTNRSEGTLTNPHIMILDDASFS